MVAREVLSVCHSSIQQNVFQLGINAGGKETVRTTLSETQTEPYEGRKTDRSSRGEHGWDRRIKAPLWG